jgi:hypothetical protein
MGRWAEAYIRARIQYRFCTAEFAKQVLAELVPYEDEIAKASELGSFSSLRVCYLTSFIKTQLSIEQKQSNPDVSKNISPNIDKAMRVLLGQDPKAHGKLLGIYQQWRANVHKPFEPYREKINNNFVFAVLRKLEAIKRKAPEIPYLISAIQEKQEAVAVSKTSFFNTIDEASPIADLIQDGLDYIELYGDSADVQRLIQAYGFSSSVHSECKSSVSGINESVGFV